MPIYRYPVVLWRLYRGYYRWLRHMRDPKDTFIA